MQGGNANVGIPRRMQRSHRPLACSPPRNESDLFSIHWLQCMVESWTCLRCSFVRVSPIAITSNRASHPEIGICTSKCFGRIPPSQHVRVRIEVNPYEWDFCMVHWCPLSTQADTSNAPVPFERPSSPHPITACQIIPCTALKISLDVSCKHHPPNNAFTSIQNQGDPSSHVHNYHYRGSVTSIHNCRYLTIRATCVSDLDTRTQTDVATRFFRVRGARKAHVLRRIPAPTRERRLVASRDEARGRSWSEDAARRHGKGREARHHPPDDGRGASRAGRTRMAWNAFVDEAKASWVRSGGVACAPSF